MKSNSRYFNASFPLSTAHRFKLYLKQKKKYIRVHSTLELNLTTDQKGGTRDKRMKNKSFTATMQTYHIICWHC